MPGRPPGRRTQVRARPAQQRSRRGARRRPGIRGAGRARRRRAALRRRRGPSGAPSGVGVAPSLTESIQLRLPWVVAGQSTSPVRCSLVRVSGFGRGANPVRRAALIAAGSSGAGSAQAGRACAVRGRRWRPAQGAARRRGGPPGRPEHHSGYLVSPGGSSAGKARSQPRQWTRPSSPGGLSTYGAAHERQRSGTKCAWSQFGHHFPHSTHLWERTPGASSTRLTACCRSRSETPRTR